MKISRTRLQNIIIGLLGLLGRCNGLTDLAKRVRPTPVVDATLAPSYFFEGAGGLAPQPFWPLAAGTG